MSFDDCVGRGLIKRSSDAQQRIKQSVALGDGFLKSARKNFEISEYVVCELIAYNALFHYARALLFKQGYIERSHACLFITLKRFYPAERALFERADRIRIERHNLQYSGLNTNKESAAFVLNFVKEFSEKTGGLLEG